MPVLMQAKHLDVVALVEREAVVDALWQHNHVALAAVDADPPVVMVPHIKVSCTQHPA